MTVFMTMPKMETIRVCPRERARVLKLVEAPTSPAGTTLWAVMVDVVMVRPKPKPTTAEMTRKTQ